MLSAMLLKPGTLTKREVHESMTPLDVEMMRLAEGHDIMMHDNSQIPAQAVMQDRNMMPPNGRMMDSMEERNMMGLHHGMQGSNMMTSGGRMRGPNNMMGSREGNMMGNSMMGSHNDMMMPRGMMEHHDTM